MKPYAGPNRDGHLDDGDSRPFQDGSTDPRHVVARCLAESNGWAEIRPGHWAQAGRIVAALRTKQLLVDRRRKPGGAR